MMANEDGDIIETFDVSRAILARMIKQYYFPVIILFCSLYSKWIITSAFHCTSSFLKINNLPLKFSHNNPFCLYGSVDGYIRNDLTSSSSSGYSILPVTNRERVLDVMVYRFGVESQPTIEEHTKKNPQLTSREDVLRSLTRSFDDDGKQKVFYADDEGEAVQFFALADDISTFVSNKEQHDDDNKEKVNELLIRTHGVIGSVQATKNFSRNNDNKTIIFIELVNLSVHAKFRRMGIGKALTEAVQQYACRQLILEQQQQQIKEVIVYLLVEPDNKGAIRLYADSGFFPDRHENNQMNWSTDGAAL
jgi:ribosomal protein S18 acetylase RimI-like enzyme